MDLINVFTCNYKLTVLLRPYFRRAWRKCMHSVIILHRLAIFGYPAKSHDCKLVAPPVERL